MASVKKVESKSDLETKLTEAGDKLVLIDFYATWCGPCKRIAPFLEQIAEEHKDDLVVLKVDVDEVEELISDYNIEVMPTFVLKRKGEHLDTMSGSNQTKLIEIIEKHLEKK